jgi:Spy/CpxP family protein refolding chaperone
MKKLTLLLLIALMIPAGLAFGQMQWHDKDADQEVFIFEGKGRGFDGPGKGCGMGHGMKGCRPGMHGILAMADELGLTDDQKDKLRQMATEHQLAMVDKHAAVKKAQIALKALKHDEADDSKVLAAIDEVARLKADVQKAQYSHHQQVKGLLTEEQVQKMKSLHMKTGNMEFHGEPGHRGMKRRVIEFDTDG